MPDAAFGLAGPWELRQRRGSGGFGVVWVAQRPDADGQFAIKLLDPAEIKVEITFAEARRRFRREVETQLRLQPHPNVMPIIDFDLDPEKPWFRMPLAEKTLDETLRDKPEDERIVEIILGLAAGIRHAHENGVIHRDLKPTNVLFLPGDPAPKISDFGLVVDEWSASTRQTQIGMGSHHYSAPEVFDDPLGVDRRADVFSLGRILQDLLSGGASPRSINPRLPEKYRSLISRATAEDREERYRSVDDLIEAFGQIRAGFDQAEIADEGLKSILDTWRSSTEIPVRLDVVSLLGNLFERHSGNERFMLDAFPRLPADLLEFWAGRFPGSLARATRQYDVHVAQLPLIGFDFQYLDDVAALYVRLFRLLKDTGLKRELMQRLLWAGRRWDELDIARAITELLSTARESDILLVNETLRDRPEDTAWLRAQRFLSAAAVPSAIKRTLEELGAEPLRLDDLRGLRELAYGGNLVEHVADGRTVRLGNYPSAVRVDGPSGDASELKLHRGTATISFAPSVRGVHLTFQQGLYATRFDVVLRDGRRFQYDADPTFYPESTEFGLLAPLDVASISLLNERGSVDVRAARFWATRTHERIFTTGS